MIDVKIGVPREPLVDEINEGLERPAFRGAIVRPQRAVARRGTVEGEDAKEIFEAPRRSV